MMNIKKLLEITLEPGETAVSITTFRDYVLVVTDKGTIYQITCWDEKY